MKRATEERNPSDGPRRDSLALFVQEVEQRRGLLADQVDAAGVVDVVDVVPADALRPIFLLRGENDANREFSAGAAFSKTCHPGNAILCKETVELCSASPMSATLAV